MGRVTLFLVLACVVLCEGEIVVNSTSGVLIGKAEDGVRKFLGVRYAETPSRFKNSELKSYTNEIQEANQTGAYCVQSDYLNTSSEDCLFLNIFAPEQIDVNSTIPIVFYIHGGSFDSGHATTSAWNLTKLHQVLVVAPQYRLGIFGFLDDNYGLYDQVLALKWTNLNAHNFNADKTRILLLGCSAGGASVLNFLLDSQLLTQYAAAAIESPGGHAGWQLRQDAPDDDFMSSRKRQQYADQLSHEYNLTQLDTLTLYNASQIYRFAPAFTDSDNNDIYPLQLLRSLNYTLPPLIVGSQSCESCKTASDYIGPPSDNITKTQLRSALIDYGFDDIIGVDTLLSWYEWRTNESNWRKFARILSDSDHACNAVLAAWALLPQTTHLWRYYFAFDSDPTYPGATHCSLENFIWHLDGHSDLLTFPMSTWWTNLAAYGNVNYSPSFNTATFWPSASSFSDQSLLGGTPFMFMGDGDDPTPRLDTTINSLRPECRHWAPYLGWNASTFRISTDPLHSSL